MFSSIPTSELSKHCSTLTICRPWQSNKERISRLFVPTTAGLQLTFDVVSSNSNGNTTTVVENNTSTTNSSPSLLGSNTHEPTVEVVLNLMQKSLTNAQAVGFRLHAVELNRRHKVHDFGSVELVGSWDPVVGRLMSVTVRLPLGRYLLTPIAMAEVPLMVSVVAVAAGSATGLKRLTADMPRYQPLSFLSPKYPVAVSRLVVFGVDGLEKQDRFGCKLSSAFFLYFFLITILLLPVFSG